MTGSSTNHLQGCLDRFRLGDPEAREALLRNSQQRLLLLTRKMLRRYPAVRRWEETDDVFQHVLLRLDRMLDLVTVTSVRDYLRLAGTHIRYVLIDLTRHYYGPTGLGVNYATPGGAADSANEQAATAVPDSSSDPSKLAAWGEFHRQVDLLPDAEREVFDLLWYQGLTQGDAAQLLGLSLSTVKRRWLTARVKLAEALEEDFPL